MRLHGDPERQRLESPAEAPAGAVRYQPFHASTRVSGRPMPALACDAQIHVFGPADRYPPRPDAVYQAPTASFVEARRMHAALGLTRTVIVQPTTYGTDHTALLDALAAGGQFCRGCAVIDDSVSDAELRRLHAAGVRAARFNFFTALRAVPDAATFRRAIARIAELGWCAKLNLDPGGLITYAELLGPLRLPVVIDHFGRPDFAQGPHGRGVREVVAALANGHTWVMLSNGHKLSRTGPPWDDAIPIARAFIETAPDRVIWGTDWPHPLSTSEVPDDADLLDLLLRVAPDAAERQAILVDTPASLFGFAPAQ